MAYGMIPKKGRSAMAEGLGFYSDLTEIAEGRITDLITHAEAAERRADAFLPQAGAYYRACALTVFMAWRDVTEGWQALHDCGRLARVVRRTGPAALDGRSHAAASGLRAAAPQAGLVTGAGEPGRYRRHAPAVDVALLTGS